MVRAQSTPRSSDIGRPSHDPVLGLLRSVGWDCPAVEIGASNGWRLAAMLTQQSGEYVAVEPSVAAIADGSERYPGIRFLQAHRRTT